MEIVNFLCEKINLSIYLSFQPVSFKNRDNGPSDSVIQILKKSEFEIAGKCTSNYKINVKIALLFPKNHVVMRKVHKC